MGGPIKHIMHSIRRKPSKTSDARSETAAAAQVGVTSEAEKTNVLRDLTHLGVKDGQTMIQAISAIGSGEPMDDKEFMLENGVSMLQRLPPNSELSQKISDGFISVLWHDLPHPPPTLVGPAGRYRRHDGSGNNPWWPEMGKAGSPYARNVPPTKPKGPNLPDVESVFEALLKRKGPFRNHPSGLNRLFFSFATVVIHECFQTSRSNPFINETSSYVDLSTLYGNTGEEQKRVRTEKNGLIFPDTIASERIMMMPPGVVAVLLMFARNHNIIAQNLLSIDEEERYKPWETLKEKDQKWQDEDIFQLTRNINVGFFASVVLHDYVAAILNTPRANSEWSLNLGKEIKQLGKRVERGSGNVISVEFAVLYHWHAALSAADDEWMEMILRKENPELGDDIDDITHDMFMKVMKKHGHELISTNANTWTFGGLKRQADGRFKDSDLADIIKSCIDEPAHEFGAHGTPASLRIVDIMGQLQAREVFNVCTLNEFRRYLNLKAYKTFEDWNPDKETARAAKLLYGHIENLELYPGLMAECTKPPMPGSGVCPGQTTGRGILDDAVALVRGDRFLSYDFNANTLTHWGAALLQGGSSGGSFGNILPTLLFNSLPGAFTGTSTYALLPFYTPEAAIGILEGNKVSNRYDIIKPSNDLDVISIQTAQGCTTAMQDDDAFRIVQPTVIHSSSKSFNLLFGWHTDQSDNKLLQAFFEQGFESNVNDFFTQHVQELIQKNSLSFKKGRKSIDIVRDVINIAPILWLAERFALPLKSHEQPRGVFTEYEAFVAYLDLFAYQSFNVQPGKEWKLRDGAIEGAALLQPIFNTHLETQKGMKERVVDWLAKGSSFEVGPHADRLYHALNGDKSQSISDSAGDCIGLGAAIAGLLTQQASLLVDLFLSPGYATYKTRLVELSTETSASSLQELQGYILEGIRHAGIVPGLVRTSAKDSILNDGLRGPVSIKANRTVLLATSKAAMDPSIFSEPENLDPNRSRDAYAVLGFAPLFLRFVLSALAATLRQVFALKQVRRAHGKQGKLVVVEKDFAGIKLRTYLDAQSRESSIPTSMTLDYDD